MRSLARPALLARRPVRALLAQWALAVSGEVEGIHQARVASRRLRELVPALAHPRDAHEARRLRRRLRVITRLLGRSRELDVALETLAGIEARAPSLGPPVAAVRDHIRRERAEAGRAAQALAQAVDIGRLADGVLALAARNATAAAARGCVRRVSARLGRRAGELEQAVVDAGLIFAPAPLHAVRIAVKKFRYALEVAERLGRFRLTGSMRRLKSLQNLLGDLHDLQVLCGLVRDVEAQAAGASRREFEALVETVDREIRALHGRFVTERDGIVALLARAADVRRALAAMPPPAAPVRPARPGSRPRSRPARRRPWGR
jgi:CHAD domain-containing protein